MWPLALARKRHTTHSAMCLQTHTHILEHAHTSHADQQSHTERQRVAQKQQSLDVRSHTNMYCTQCYSSQALRACSQADRGQRPTNMSALVSQNH